MTDAVDHGGVGGSRSGVAVAAGVTTAVAGGVVWVLYPALVALTVRLTGAAPSLGRQETAVGLVTMVAANMLVALVVLEVVCDD